MKIKKIASKFRFLSWLIKAFILRYRQHLMFGFIGGFVVLLLSIRTYPVITSLLPPRKIVGIVGQYTPTTLPLSIQNLISFGLTSVSPQGEALPALATSWETKETGNVYIFRLREDVFWHNGEKFTAYDVNYNLKDVKIKPLDEFTIEFRLNEPFSPLPVLLSRPLFKQGLIGTGTYKVSRLKLNVDRIEMISLTPAGEKGRAPELVFRFYPTEASAVTAFKLGEVNILQDLNDVYNLSSWPGITIEEKVLLNQIVTIFFNENYSILKEKAFRQALNFAIPNLGKDRAWGPISPLSWTFSKNVKTYKFDLAKAMELIKNDGIATNPANLTLSTFPPFLSMAQKIADSWKKIEITTSIRVENAIPEDAEALLTIQELPPDPDQYPLWHSTQERTNISNLKNPKIDKLLEDGRKTLDKDERKEIYADFQKYLVDLSTAAFLYYPKVYTISRK